VQQAPVIYVAAEGGRGIQQRAKQWMEYYGRTDLDAMYWLLSPLYVREEGTVEAFLDKLEDIDVWPGLIVLDTLSRSFGGGEENASADMGHFVDQITKLAQGRRMASLIVHHTNALGNRERGSTAFRGAADAMFGCHAHKDKDTNRILCIELKNDKQKDAEETPSIWLRPKDGLKTSVILEWTEKPQSAHEEETKKRIDMSVSAMLDILQAAPEGMKWEEWWIRSKLAKRTFWRRVKKLMADSIIFKDEAGFYQMYPANADVEDGE
jgi:hypothetical protein